MKRRESSASLGKLGEQLISHWAVGCPGPGRGDEQKFRLAGAQFLLTILLPRRENIKKELGFNPGYLAMQATPLTKGQWLLGSA